MRNDALWEAVGLDLVLQGECAQAGTSAQCPPMTLLTIPSAAKWLRPRVPTIALASGVDQGEAPWGARLDKTPLEGEGEFLREPDTDEAVVATVSPSMTTRAASSAEMTLWRLKETPYPLRV